MSVRVTFRWGRLADMPKCEHGRIEGFCRCWDPPKTPTGSSRERPEAPGV